MGYIVMRMPDEKGFTLIELMIAVAIIGILAAIAIPNFLLYQARSKQTEAKMLLKAMHTSEVAYFTDNGFFTSDAAALEWRPQTNCRYRYSVGVGYMGNPDDVGVPMNAATPGAGSDNFTAVGWANIDMDPAVDTWQVTNFELLKSVYNDVNETNAI